MGLGEAQGVIFMMKIKKCTPPVSNRGGYVYMELENSYLIDWLSFTVRTADPLDVIEKLGFKSLNLLK